MKANVHPTDPHWDQLVQHHYGNAYQELTNVFRQLLGQAFMKNYWIPDPLALDYLTKILIRFLPVTNPNECIDEALALCDIESDDPRDTIRFYESAGELILWWSGLYRRPVYQSEGKRMYSMAYERLSDCENEIVLVIPGQENKQGSKRLRVNKMFSEQFENYQEVLNRSDLIDDPAYKEYRSVFIPDDRTIN